MFKILLVLLVNFIFKTTAIPSNYGSVGDHLEEIGDFWEGDMVLDSNQISSLLNRKVRNAIRAEDYRWPNQTVFYEIDSTTIDTKHAVQISYAIQLIENSTCVRFYPRNENTTDYILVTGYPTGCDSPVGRRGGMQILNLVSKVSKCLKILSIAHEFIHALGFFHQQNAPERDSYVKIFEENIIPAQLFAFKKKSVRTARNFGVGYDYDSVMHYGEYAFSANGKKTVMPLNETAIIGQRDRLSEKDILKINLMYNCTDYLFPELPVFPELPDTDDINTL